MDTLNNDMLSEILLYLDIADINSFLLIFYNSMYLQSLKKNRNFWVKYLKLNPNSEYGSYLITLPYNCANYITYITNILKNGFLHNDTYIIQKYKINLEVSKIKYSEIFSLCDILEGFTNDPTAVFYRINNNILEIIYKIKSSHGNIIDFNINNLYSGLFESDEIRLCNEIYHKYLEKLIQKKEMELSTLQQKLNIKNDNIGNLLFTDFTFIVDSHNLRTLKDEILFLKKNREKRQKRNVSFILIKTNWCLISEDNLQRFIYEHFNSLPIFEYIRTKYGSEVLFDYNITILYT
ncbi:Transmembrane domain-containing protein [Orpheovirus IHUMI-LCC2]|uniref:Transmembrane domain-containing protein n=1 Tax=Orpheovirus IHUMI-LCC2 TaxID=2023057 RepID=A0A2I2L4N5_9VIRU|nr:Transmembrane domain-containing protein [Orpheovirus IHUMI-LCC2]SNW62471.1 Transmembrane domain-containing protein [Orpheovirus IHUMI-LCC2]